MHNTGKAHGRLAKANFTLIASVTHLFFARRRTTHSFGFL
jgi:hypothetical protein